MGGASAEANIDTEGLKDSGVVTVKAISRVSDKIWNRSGRGSDVGDNGSKLQGTAPTKSGLELSSLLDIERIEHVGVSGKDSEGTVASPTGQCSGSDSRLMGERGLPESSPPNWRSLFADGPKSCAPLVFSPPSIVDGKTVINPPAGAVLEGVEFWEGCIVGQFLDKRLPLLSRVEDVLQLQLTKKLCL